MGALVRAYDWAATPLGPPEAWPQSLRTAVGMVLGSGFPACIVWGPQLVTIYNDAFRPILGVKREALGRPFSDVWREAWGTIGPMAERALAGEATFIEDLPLTIERNGYPEEAFFTFSYSPIRDETGGVAGFLDTVFETTGKVLAERALRKTAVRWRRLFRRMSEGFALCEIVYDGQARAVDFRFIELNSAFERLTGIPIERAVGRTVRDLIPTIERDWIEAFAKVSETGEPTRRLGRVATLGRWFEALAYRTEPGRVAVLFVDVTERKAADERQALFTRELNHRAKNALAVVQAALRLTKAPDVQSFRQAVEGRVGALARTQTLLAKERWTGADLATLLQDELAPFLGQGRDDGPTVHMEGSPIAVPAEVAQPLAMALHELATNAVKYGALSVPAGRVAISWRLESRPCATLRLRWAEAGGPPVAGPPERRGFGSRVLDSTVRIQLGGKVSLEWRGTGLVCEIEFPLTCAHILPDN